jgi:hypothetical protein
VSVVWLFGKLLAQWLAAGYLSLPAVLLWVWVDDPERLRDNDFVWVNACLAPLAALWVVLRHRRGRPPVWWVAGQVVGLLLASAAVTWVAMDPAELGVRELDPLRIGAVLVLVWVWIAVWRSIDPRLWPAPTVPVPRPDGGAPPAAPTRPQRGEIWSAMVPFEEGSFEDGEQDAKDRPCVVISTFTRHAYVLKITSVDQGDRPGYLALEAGWHPWSDKASWVKLQPLLKVPFSEFRQYVCDSPDRVWADLRRRYSPDAVPRPAQPGNGPRATTGPAGRGPGHRNRR